MQRSFISVTWTPGVDAEDAQVLIRTIEEVYRLLRPHFGAPGQFDPLPAVHIFGAWTKPEVPQTSAYANVEWYIAHSLDETHRSIMASRYLEAVELEPCQSSSPHLDLAVTELPLIDDLSGGPPPVSGDGGMPPQAAFPDLHPPVSRH
jgi:hypothetical protein